MYLFLEAYSRPSPRLGPGYLEERGEVILVTQVSPPRQDKTQKWTLAFKAIH